MASEEPSGFEQWERSRKVEMEMLTAVAQAVKTRAEADLLEAQAENEHQATVTAEIINRHLQFTLRNVKKREAAINQELVSVRSHASLVGILREARKVSPVTCSAAWRALSWFITNATGESWGDAYVAPLEPSCRSEYVWTTMTEPEEPDAQESATLAGMVEWMLRNFALPRPGSKLHRKLLTLIQSLEKADSARIAELEAWRDKLHKLTNDDLAALKEVLGVALAK